MAKQSSVQTAYDVCRLILKYGPECKKGKTVLRKHMAKKLRISANNIRPYTRTINAVLGEGTPAVQHKSGEKNLYTILCGDEKFKKLAKEAMEMYEWVGHLGKAYLICEKIIVYGPKCKKGKGALKRYVAKKLKITENCVAHYIQTINAIIGNGEPYHAHNEGEVNIYTTLRADKKFRAIAEKTLSVYTSVPGSEMPGGRPLGRKTKKQAKEPVIPTPKKRIVPRPVFVSPYCPNCRRLVPPNRKKCPRCGHVRAVA